MIEGEVKHMIEQKMRLIWSAKRQGNSSNLLQITDLIVMASSRSSLVAKRILGSTSRSFRHC